MSDLHHVPEGDCPLCEEKLKDALPLLNDWFKLVIKPRFPETHIACSFRNKIDQEIAFIGGKSLDHFPNSPHNKCDMLGNPCSLALDLFQIIKGKGVWNGLFFAQLNAINELKGYPLLWGGKFKHLGDFDHFQWDIHEEGDPFFFLRTHPNITDDSSSSNGQS